MTKLFFYVDFLQKLEFFFLLIRNTYTWRSLFNHRHEVTFYAKKGTCDWIITFYTHLIGGQFFHQGCKI